MASELWELGATAEYIPADVSVKDDAQALVDGTVKTFGKLNVTGTSPSLTGSTSQLATQTLGAYNTVFDTSGRGLLFCLKHELRVMTEQGSGSIVNLFSTFGERGGAGAVLYSASKHAVKDPRGSVRKTEGDGTRFSDREGAISGRRRRYSTTPPMRCQGSCSRGLKEAAPPAPSWRRPGCGRRQASEKTGAGDAARWSMMG